MRFPRMLRQGLAMAAALSMVTVWPAAPVFAADKNIDLDGNTTNGAESNSALNVVTTSPTQIKNKVTNKAIGQAFRFTWPGAGPGGFSSAVIAGSTAGVGAIWTWQTNQQIFSINSDITFNQTAPGTVQRRFTGLPGRSLTSAGITTSSASLTSSLITFFSPPIEKVRVESRVTPLAGGLFKYTTEVTNLTGDPIDYDWHPGPLGCASEVCGNGVQEGSEQCDGTDLNGASCEVFGGTGSLGCDDGCGYDLSGCADVCGNGVRDGVEECEGSDLNGESCESLGYASGSLACDGECGFDTSGCVPAECGNGVREGFEECDGSDVGKDSCFEHGYSGGNLGCNGECFLDFSECTSYVCGNGVREGSEQCDGSDLAGNDCNTLGFECGTLDCAGDCSFDTSSCTNLCFAGSAAPLSSARTPRALGLTGKTTTSAVSAGVVSGTGAARSQPQGVRRSTGRELRRVPARLAPLPRTQALPVGENPCDFPGQIDRVDGNSSKKTCKVSAHPAKEVTSEIVVCGDGLPSGPQGCAGGPNSGNQGTANVFVPALDVDIGDAFLSAVHVAVDDGLNGFAEPGETFKLLVGLINTGPQDLTNVTATLSAVVVDIDGDGTPDAPVITQATSAYPTIPGLPSGSGDCDSAGVAIAPVYNVTPFVVTLPAGFPPDANLHFVLTVNGTAAGCVQAFCLGAFAQDVGFVAGVGSECSLTNLDGSYTKVEGFLSPMGPLVPAGDPFPDVNAASTNRTRPLKLRLFCGSTNLGSSLVAAPQVVALTRDGVPLDVTKVDLDDNANNNSLLFRFSSGFWIYNMRTKLLGHGTFVITIRFANGQEYQSQFVL